MVKCWRPPRKRRFDDELAARKRLWEIRAMDATMKMPVRTYECHYCDGWHLSGNFKAAPDAALYRRSKKNRRR